MMFGHKNQIENIEDYLVWHIIFSTQKRLLLPLTKMPFFFLLNQLNQLSRFIHDTLVYILITFEVPMGGTNLPLPL